MPKFIDLTGERFGRLLVLYREEDSKGYHPRWIVQCDCGQVFSVEGPSLRRGRTKSCGCLFTDMMTKHGKADTPEYVSWHGMMYRCFVPTCRVYKHYGGRGITVCDRWHEFENFYADMAPRPPNRSLDRINNDGNYEPGNCRWATQSEQINNRRPFTKKAAKE